MRESRLHEQGGGEHVGGEDPGDRIDLHLSKWLLRHGRCVVHDHVHTAPAEQRLLDHALDVFRMADVCHEGRDIGMFPGGLGQRLLPAAGDQNLCTHLRELRSGGSADPGASAGDDRYSILRVHALPSVHALDMVNASRYAPIPVATRSAPTNGSSRWHWDERGSKLGSIALNNRRV